MPSQEDSAIISPDALLMVVVLYGAGLLAFILVIILNIINNPFWPFVWLAFFGVILFTIALFIPGKHEKARVIREERVESRHVESRRRNNKHSILPMIILYSTVISGILIGAFLGPFLPICVRGLIAFGIFSIVLITLYGIMHDDS